MTIIQEPETPEEREIIMRVVEEVAEEAIKMVKETPSSLQKIKLRALNATVQGRLVVAGIATDRAKYLAEGILIIGIGDSTVPTPKAYSLN